MFEIELLDHLTVCLYKISLLIIHLIYMQKQDLTLNHQQHQIIFKCSLYVFQHIKVQLMIYKYLSYSYMYMDALHGR